MEQILFEAPEEEIQEILSQDQIVDTEIVEEVSDALAEPEVFSNVVEEIKEQEKEFKDEGPESNIEDPKAENT